MRKARLKVLKPLTSAEIELILRNRAEGKSWTEIGRLFNCGRESIRCRASHLVKPARIEANPAPKTVREHPAIFLPKLQSVPGFVLPVLEDFSSYRVEALPPARIPCLDARP